MVLHVLLATVEEFLILTQETVSAHRDRTGMESHVLSFVTAEEFLIQTQEAVSAHQD
jgi:hypothetical protein